jgi:hypothetical protein
VEYAGLLRLKASEETPECTGPLRCIDCLLFDMMGSLLMRGRFRVTADSSAKAASMVARRRAEGVKGRGGGGSTLGGEDGGQYTLECSLAWEVMLGEGVELKLPQITIWEPDQILEAGEHACGSG